MWMPMPATVSDPFTEYDNMTHKKQILRLFILAALTVGLAFGGRELFYFQSIERHPLMVQVPLSQLIGDAELIVRGTVEKSIGTSRYRDQLGELTVGTRWKVTVVETMKGMAPDELIVRTLGGRYGLTELWVEDEVEFTPGEEAILFLERDPESSDFRVGALYQGHYTVQNDTAVQQESGTSIPIAEMQSHVRDTLLVPIQE